jgi:sugar lactone lactonase YvrE
VLAVAPAMAQVPAVVATSTSTIATGFSAGPAATDACGNVYVYEGGGSGIVQINASTGAVTTIVKNAQGYTSTGQALYMDVAKKYLYFPDFGNFYTTHFDQLPINNCVPGTVNNNFANNLGNLGNYYWGTVIDAAGDAAGNVYFSTTSNITQAIYKETYSASANTYSDSQILTWKNSISHLAADAAGDVFFVDFNTQDVYMLALNGTTYATTPTIFLSASHFGTVSGMSLDPQGNLYITDSSTNLVFEVPNESGKLNPNDLYVTAAAAVPFKVAVDANHTIYLSNYSPGAVKIASGSAIAPATAVGSTSASFALNYYFNAAATPSAINALSGTSTATPFTIAAAVKGACVAGTVQAASTACSVNLTFSPTAVGRQTGAVIFTTGSGSLVSAVSGVGNGSAVTIDPGSVIPSTTTFTAPSGVAVDNLGNIFVTDTTANTLTEFAAGSSGAGTTVSTGTLKLSAPKGVAVDSVGDIFIADTGNNRVVEIPVVAGVLANASAFALSPALKAPQSVAVDAANNLLIADTGDNNLLFVPNINGSLSFTAAQSFGSSLNGPNAIAIDPSGNVYLAESGNNDVLEFPGPLGSAAQVKVASGLSTPTGVATDASGSLFVVDSGSGSVFRYPNVNGLLGARSLVGVSIVSPVGVAADASGNLYVTDTTNDVVAEIGRVAGTLQFGGVNVGSTGTQTGAINNSGNLPLIFQKPDYAINANPATGFAVTADTCSGATVAPGSACSITSTYTPSAPQLNAEEDLTLAANGSNGTPVLKLIGTGAHITPSTVTLVLTSPAGTLSAGQSVTFTATIGTGSNTAVAGGSVKFFVNGTQVGTVAVKSGAAVLTLKNGLPGGSAVVVLAQYTGDVINYSGSSSQLTEPVNFLSDTASLAVVAPYNNPLSATDDVGTLALSGIARNNNIVTATVASNPLAVGAAVQVTGVNDSSYNGVFQVTAVSATTISWSQAGMNTNSTGGSIAARIVSATGPSIVLTATVVPSFTIPPGGLVTFYAGSTVLGVASVVPISTTLYQATLTTTALRSGTGTAIEGGSFISTYALSAAYSGDSTYLPAATNSLPISILSPPSSAPACALTSPNGTAPTCLLNLTGASFTITPSNPTITVTSTGVNGQASGSATLTVTSYGGWSGVLNFNCSGLPAYASCAPFPGAPLITASTPASTLQSTTVSFVINTNVPPVTPTASGLVWWSAGAGGLLLLLFRRRLRTAGYLRSYQMLSLAGLLLLSGALAFSVTACSSATNLYPTPTGTSQVKVTVSAAQNVPGTTTGAVLVQDGNVPPITVTLVVQ